MNNRHNTFYQSVTDLIQKGKLEKALTDIEGFLETNPYDEVGLSIYGNALLRSGDQEKAFETFEHAVDRYPKSYAVHTDLAFVSMKVGKIKQAIESFENAAQLNPKFYLAWASLGKLYFEDAQYSKALEAVENAENNDPFDADYKKMQKALHDGNIVEGEQIARNILKKQPGHPRAGYMLAHIASKVGALEEQADILRYCLEYHPANIIIRKELVATYEELGDYQIALEEAEILLKLEQNTHHYCKLSRIYSQLGNHENALLAAEDAANCIEDDSEELGQIDLLRGHTLRVLGRRKESEDAYKRCIKNTKNNGTGWWGLADLKTYKFSDKDMRDMGKLSNDQNINAEQRCQAAFSLAKAHENNGDTETAFNWYKIGNDLRPNLTFNADKNDEYCESFLEKFDKKMLKTQANPRPAGPTPIFIVGMPRAGSTLIEQILSSHSQIEGTMELSTLPKLGRKIKIRGGQKFKQHYPECLINFNEAELAEFGQEYIDRTAAYRSDKAYYIDKLPPNFERVGLIHKILPQAIIIDARRHPLDCGFSAYKQHFAAGHEYSYDFKNIGNYYNGYLKFMDHWDDVLPGKVLCVQYENMVYDTENTVRKVLSHIGVDFEESCMRFYENKRAVRTASSEQVRQPINTKGIGQWKTVADHLEPLIESLGKGTMKRFEEFLPKE